MDLTNVAIVMPTKREGGLNAAKVLKAKYGKDYYAKIGAKGGKKSTTGGFWHRKYVLDDTEYLSTIGRIGGAKGKRGKATKW